MTAAAPTGVFHYRFEVRIKDPDDGTEGVFSKEVQARTPKRAWKRVTRDVCDLDINIQQIVLATTQEIWK